MICKAVIALQNAAQTGTILQIAWKRTGTRSVGEGIIGGGWGHGEKKDEI